MKKYAVSLVYVKVVGYTMTVTLRSMITVAQSEEEALGGAVNDINLGDDIGALHAYTIMNVDESK